MAWLKHFKKKDLPKTCQDIWHVLHRIDSVMAHNHPGKHNILFLTVHNIKLF